MKFIDDPVAYQKYLYHHCHCVNAGQLPKRRRLKYAIVKSFGKSVSEANRLRDFRDNSFARYYGYSNWKTLINFIKGE